MNAFAERWVRSIKHECLNKMIFFGPAQLERAIREYVTHYHEERPHQSLSNELIYGNRPCSGDTGDIVEHERLGGVLRYYHRAADCQSAIQLLTRVVHERPTRQSCPEFHGETHDNALLHALLRTISAARVVTHI